MSSKKPIDEIRQINRRRKMIKEEMNRKVYAMCMEKIRHFAYNGVQRIDYDIPPRFANCPYYDRNDCFDYMTHKLSTHFHVTPIAPFRLRIDWSNLT